ncbi:MAG: zinc ABC transporter ATP-binding protein [Candidatus Bathyarchaeota archaeon B26-2]|nr:MAG: zinc ABC transporter ATP-binding protein [Candidatus Bathyarchaeota archaeon B26-2]
MSEEVISLEDVWVQYNGVTVLEDITLSVQNRDFLGIIGPNGGGKTTLLKVILGLIKPNRGRVTVLGGPPEEGRRFIGYVPQLTQFDREFPATALDVVLMGRLGHKGLLRRYTEEDMEIAYKALESVEILDLKDRQVGKLSGGELQRVFLARALAADPKILLLDEPTASIDEPTKTELYELLKGLNREITIILVSHDIGVISSYVDKIACLNRRLFYHGSKEITAETIEETYRCPVELLAHGVPHRVLKKHEGK